MNDPSKLAVVAGLLFVAPALAGTPALTEAQQAKLQRIQAMFEPGGKVNSMSAGIDMSEEACGARIPVEIDASTVALEPMNGDRTEIDITCNEFASAVVYSCGTTTQESDPVVKEMIRKSIKRMVCKATSDRKLTDRGSGMSNYGVKYTLEDGTLTLLYAMGGASKMLELGKSFLDEHVKDERGFSLGGQRLKRKALEKLEQSDILTSIRERCGIALDVQVDDALFELYSHHPTQVPISVCYSGLLVIDSNCTSDGVHNLELNSPVAKEALKKHLKRVSCVVTNTVTASVKPGGVIEFGGDVEAKVPGKPMTVENYLFKWMRENASSLGKAAPQAAPKKKKPAR